MKYTEYANAAAEKEKQEQLVASARLRHDLGMSPATAVCVQVVDFSMPLWSIMIFMIKVSIASIPAAGILAVTYLLAAAILFGPH